MAADWSPQCDRVAVFCVSFCRWAVIPSEFRDGSAAGARMPRPKIESPEILANIDAFVGRNFLGTAAEASAIAWKARVRPSFKKW